MIHLIIDGQDVPYTEVTLTANPRYPVVAWDRPMPYQPPTTTVQYRPVTGVHRVAVAGLVWITREGDMETINVTTSPIDNP